MCTLMGMGFEEWACELALESVVGTIDQKLNWLLEGNHEKGNAEAEEFNQSKGSPSGGNRGAKQPAGEATETQIEQITAMGFAREDAIQALASCENDVDQAISVLLAS